MPEAGHGRGELSLGILGLLLSALLLISTRWPQAAVIARHAPPPHDASAGPDLVARNSHRGRGRFSSLTRGGRYSWARYYHPGLQRFVSEDPIGFAGGDANLYAYVGNAPTDLHDPLGLDALSDFANLSAGFGDTVTLGGTAWIRGLWAKEFGLTDVTDTSSAWYLAGRKTADTWSLALRYGRGTNLGLITFRAGPVMIVVTHRNTGL